MHIATYIPLKTLIMTIAIYDYNYDIAINIASYPKFDYTACMHANTDSATLSQLQN